MNGEFVGAYYDEHIWEVGHVSSVLGLGESIVILVLLLKSVSQPFYIDGKDGCLQDLQCFFLQDQ